jgi:UDP-N-acetylglucosamine acyltransferase
MPTQISPQACVHEDAILGDGVVVEAFAFIGPNVTIGDRTWIGPSCSILSSSTIGADCKVFPGAVIGAEPQDLKFANEPTKVVIGNRTVIRECVTIHRATVACWKSCDYSQCC